MNNTNTIRLYLTFCFIIGISTLPFGVSGKEYYGKFVGSLTGLSNNVAGEVYAADDSTLFVKNFIYDGQEHVVHFLVGSSDEPSKDGAVTQYRLNGTTNETAEVIASNQLNIIIHLPPDYKINKINWLSVWSVHSSKNLGDVNIPHHFVPPSPLVISEFSRKAHELKSGNITLLNARTFFIPNLHYDGKGPAAYFLVGKGKIDGTGTKIPDENGSYEVLHKYTGQNITIHLPNDMTMHDIEWLSMYCIRYSHNFGEVYIPKDGLNIPPALDVRSFERSGAPSQLIFPIFNMVFIALFTKNVIL